MSETGRTPTMMISLAGGEGVYRCRARSDLSCWLQLGTGRRRRASLSEGWLGEARAGLPVSNSMSVARAFTQIIAGARSVLRRLAGWWQREKLPLLHELASVDHLVDRRAFDLNVFSLFRLAQLAAPEIERAGGGSILTISSMAGENRNRRMASYGSSKAAANHLVRNIAFDLGPMNIRVNAIAPGATRTEALQKVLNKEIEQQMLAHTPIQRLGEPQDMANAALFLCSPAAAWISGQVLTVSGGGVQELD